MRIDGTLKTWNDERGFGFISPVEGGQDVFVHIQAFTTRAERPFVGQRLSFDVEIGPGGRKRAMRVQALASKAARVRKKRDSPAQWGTASYFAILAFVIVFLVVALLWHVPGWVAGLYLAASVVCFIVYAIDKSAAVAGRWRISEQALIVLGLAGGWPGAIVAQQVLRHKTTKASFRSLFWASVLINVGGFIALSSPLVTQLRG